MASLESFVDVDLNGVSFAKNEENIEDVAVIISREGSSTQLTNKNHELLDQLSKQLMSDYSRYFHLNSTTQIDELNECIDNLLAHMEEFYSIIEKIRNDGFICLDQLSVTLQPKLDQCEQLYRMIDKLERIVGHVSMQLNLMDKEVNKAEKMMGKKSKVKRLFSLIGTTQSTSQRYTYVPPDIFCAEELIKL